MMEEIDSKLETVNAPTGEAPVLPEL